MKPTDIPYRRNAKVCVCICIKLTSMTLRQRIDENRSRISSITYTARRWCSPRFHSEATKEIVWTTRNRESYDEQPIGFRRRSSRTCVNITRFRTRLHLVRVIYITRENPCPKYNYYIEEDRWRWQTPVPCNILPFLEISTIEQSVVLLSFFWFISSFTFGIAALTLCS